MNDLTKLILESGLVDKHTAQLMERWGSLEPGASDLVGKKAVTTSTLEAFAADIAELLAKQRPIKETVLDRITGEMVMVKIANQEPRGALMGDMGNVFVLASNPVAEGDDIQISKHDSDVATEAVVTSVEYVYVGEKIVAKRLTLSS